MKSPFGFLLNNSKTIFLRVAIIIIGLLYMQLLFLPRLTTKISLKNITFLLAGTISIIFLFLLFKDTLIGLILVT